MNEDIIKHMLEAQARTVTQENPPGDATSEASDIKCSCGFNMLKKRYKEPYVRGIPHHKKKRLRKKKLKQWREDTLASRMASIVYGVMKPWFECPACGKKESLLNASARNMFIVEPMPLPEHLKYK